MPQTTRRTIRITKGSLTQIIEALHEEITGMAKPRAVAIRQEDLALLSEDGLEYRAGDSIPGHFYDLPENLASPRKEKPKAYAPISKIINLFSKTLDSYTN
jgi:hypothetical protein